MRIEPENGSNENKKRRLENRRSERDCSIRFGGVVWTKSGESL